MTEVTKYCMDHQLGCGIMGGIFHLRSLRPRRTCVHSLPADSINNKVKQKNTANPKKKPPVKHSKKSETSILDSSNLAPKKVDQLLTRRQSNQKNEGRRPSNAARTSSSSSSDQTKGSQLDKAIVIKRSSTSDSRELVRVVTSDDKDSNSSKALVRAATSCNVMLSGHLGNLKQIGNGGTTTGDNSPNATVRAVDYLHTYLEDKNSARRTLNNYSKLGSNGVMGNIMRQSSGEFRQFPGLKTSTVDPEALKDMGNERYKQGKFEEALHLYDRAIVLDSSKPTYWSNRGAALLGLGRVMEAVDECTEAIRLDPSYQRAHHRLAALHVRLGEAEKALHHYKHSGCFADYKDIAGAQALQKILSSCTDARRLRDWNTLLKETEYAISYLGTDSAPQIYAMKAEALLSLHRHEEAYMIYKKAPNFSIDSCTKMFGLARTSLFLMIGAEIYMSSGRFEDAMAAAERAVEIDPINTEADTVVKRARAVASARLTGNLLFKASKFSDACMVYSEGLEHDPYNSILLCNRAACRSKLGQFEKAVEDCTTALTVRPNYSKARLRRADCNAKLERWEASIQDYEMLIRVSPADEEVGRALFEAKFQLKKHRGEDTKDLKFGCNLVIISSKERFRHFVTSPGMSVVLFCNKANNNNKEVLQLMEQVCKKFPSVNFLKVEAEDHPYLTKSEAVSSLPSFKIYKNGSRVSEIPGNKRDLLEKSVRLYSS